MSKIFFFMAGVQLGLSMINRVICIEFSKPTPKKRTYQKK